jgi:hypothetical protein
METSNHWEIGGSGSPQISADGAQIKKESAANFANEHESKVGMGFA